MPLIEPPCLKPRCGQDSVEGSAYCVDHKQTQFRRNNRAKRLPEGWAAVRSKILQRDKWICYLCGGSGADSVDHIVNNDDNNPMNLRAVHDANAPHCHKRKTAEEALRARRLRHPDASIIARARMKGLL